MGRVTGFLEGPLGDIDAQKATELTTAKLRVALGPELRPSFEAGRVALSVAHRKLQDEERQATDAASAAKQKKLQESQAKSEELGGARERLELTRDQWDAWVKEQVGEIDSQLAALEKRYNAAESDLRAITDSISLNRLEVQRLLAIVQQLLSLSQQALSTAQRNAGNRRFSVDIDLGSVQAQLAARQAEIDQLSAQYNETEQERGAVLQSAQGLLVNRQSSLNRYQEATGQAAKRIRQIKQWDQRLKNESEKLARTPDRKAQSVTAVRKRMRTWSTYEDFTIDTEKVRLLAEYGMAQP
jgi:chromosome segregation ATPase